MATDDNLFKNIISHSKEYGFIFPSSEIYDGLSAVYDYGQNGAELKNNIKEYWWKFMTLLHDNIVGIDSAIFMHPTIWKASGHVDAFNDPMLDNKDSKKRYRADVLIEDAITKMEDKIKKEVEKAAKRFGDSFDEEKFLSTNPRVLEYKKKIDETNERLKAAMSNGDMTAMKQLIDDLEITDPISGSRNWTDVRQFNLMFSTEIGSLADEANKIYLRPETAQGIFVNFLNVQKTGRMKIPFGIAQIGKAFRNEIVARQFIFRMREFEQMEMQFFVKPGEEMKWYEFWKEKRLRWHKAMGLGDVHLMAAVGACVGWIDSVLAFFGAAFVGLAWFVITLVGGGKLQRALPYGPYLAAATVLVLLLKPEIEWLLTALLRVPPGQPPINIP